MLKEIDKYPLQISSTKSCHFSEIKSPYSGEVVASVAQADEFAVDRAVCIAADSFKSALSRMPAHQRSSLLSRAASLLAEHKEDLARTIALEGGKPIKDARIEVSRAAGTFKTAAEEALRIYGEQLPMDSQPGNEGRLGIVLREPIGIVAAITPFNFPLNLVAHKVAPALAAGNTVLLKPSSQTPVSSFKLAQLLAEAGLPDGALQVIPCGAAARSQLVADHRLAMLTFTGSPAVGWQLRREVAAGVRTVLELGGNAGLVVHDDADLASAAQAACRGGYAHAGQVCISVQRVYVQKKVYAAFLDRFVTIVKSLKCGDPLAETTDVGPLVNGAAVAKTVQWLEAAVAGGAALVTGGAVLPGNIVEPAVLTNTTPDMLVICQEVFGPVVSVMPYETIAEAATAVNDRHYGLQAGVFTSNLEVAFQLARSIDAGGVMINDAPTFRSDHMPYGGRHQSGLGLEGVRYAVAEMTQPKFICLNLPKLA